MKRYADREIHDSYRYGNNHDYVRLADLIAAGALVPVADGEKCDIDDVPKDCLFVTFNGNLYHSPERNYWWPCLAGNHRPPAIQSLTIVQPVRLVPIAEAVG